MPNATDRSPHRKSSVELVRVRSVVCSGSAMVVAQDMHVSLPATATLLHWQTQTSRKKICLLLKIFGASIFFSITE